MLPVNIPLDVRVSRSECPVRAGENRQCWASGSWEMMWAQWWLDQLSKDTGHGWAGAGGCGWRCSIASPSHQPRVGEWACGHQAVQSWVPPTLARKDPISQVNISGHTLLWRELLVVRQCKKENIIVVGLELCYHVILPSLWPLICHFDHTTLTQQKQNEIKEKVNCMH